MSHLVRRRLVALLAVAAAGLLSTVPAQARSLDDVRKSGTLVVATEGAFAPFNFFEGKKLTGYEVELAEAIVKQMGLKIEWKTIGFDALLAGLQQDKWDLVIASHGINEERAKAVTFAEPHYCTGGVIVSKDGKLKTAGDLTGKVVAVQVGTSYMDNVKKVAGVKEVKTFPKDPEVMAALAAGRVDAAVSDKFTVREALGSKALAKAGLKIGDFLFVEQVAAAVGKGNGALAGAYNAALKTLQGDGTVAKISQKYFKEDVTCK